MKYFLVILVIICASCKAQKDKYLITKADGYTTPLPAIQLEKSEEKSLIESALNSKSNTDFQKVIIDNKDYSPKEFLSISHTLDSSYTFSMKVDSLSKSKVLVISKK